MRGEKKSELRNINSVFFALAIPSLHLAIQIFFCTIKNKKGNCDFSFDNSYLFLAIASLYLKMLHLAIHFFISIQNCEKSLNCEIKSFFHSLAGTFWD